MVRAQHLPHGGHGGHGCEGNSTKSAQCPLYSHAVAAVHCDGSRDQNRRQGPHLQGRHVHMHKARSVPRPHEVHLHGGRRPRGKSAWGWQEVAGWAEQGLKQVQRDLSGCKEGRKDAGQRKQHEHRKKTTQRMAGNQRRRETKDKHASGSIFA